jgi:hypothetical protein
MAAKAAIPDFFFAANAYGRSLGFALKNGCDRHCERAKRKRSNPETRPPTVWDGSKNMGWRNRFGSVEVRFWIATPRFARLAMTAQTNL